MQQRSEETRARIIDSAIKLFSNRGYNKASRAKKIWEASIAPYRHYHKYFTSLIKKGVQEGSFVEVDPELAARMVVSTAMGLLFQSLLDLKGANWEKVARESTTLLLNSLLK